MIKIKINFFLLLTFFFIALFPYLNNQEFKNFFFEKENINFIIKIINFFLILIFLFIIIKKNKYLLKYNNLDKLDIIFLIFITLFILNYLISFYLDNRFFNLKNICLLGITSFIFLIFRFVSISITKISKNFLFILSICFLISLIILFKLFSGNIFSTSANPITLILYIIYIWILANEKKILIKLFYLIIFLFIFYFLKSKFFLFFSFFSLIFSFKKFRYFNILKIFILFITLYFILNLSLPFILQKTIDNDKNIHRSFVSNFLDCQNVFEINKSSNSYSETGLSDKTIKNCLIVNENSKFLRSAYNFNKFIATNSFVFSIGYRLSHINEVFIHSKKNYFLPTFLSYSDLVKFNEKSQIKQSTPHNSFGIILIRLGLPGIILIFYFFYKICSFGGSNYKTYYKYNLIILLVFFSLNDQLFFHNFLASSFFWFFCSQIVCKNKIKYV